jgi:DNA-binding NtrC family response regulator
VDELTPRRDYSLLCLALSEALRAFSRGGAEEEALKDSFEAAVRGVGARKALLLLVEGREPLKLRALQVKGNLNLEQVKALEQGSSAPGVSASAIKRVIETRETYVVQDPRLLADANLTSAFADPRENFSVLCAPVLNAGDESIIAVLYFQNSVPGEAYLETDVEWMDTYTRAIAHAFGYYFQTRTREQRLKDLLQQVPTAENGPELIGDSFHTQRLRRDLHEFFIPAANGERPEAVLITGEKGTGKEVVARYIQAHSDRADEPFVVASAGEITPEMASARFFGHKRGSFTDARSDEPGLFRQAHGGVLFLDEIGYLPRAAQATLLRVLDFRTVQPVGTGEQIPVDCLVILATNKDLAEAVKAGEFLPDLYDRIMAGHLIELQPLRERLLDVPSLLEHYRLVYERRLRKRTLGYEPTVMRQLTGYAWPGNVRELVGACFKLVSYTPVGSRINRDSLERALPGALKGNGASAMERALPHGLAFRDATRSYQRDLILARLEQFDGDLAAARNSLQLPEATLRRYMRLLGIGPTPRRAASHARNA